MRRRSPALPVAVLLAVMASIVACSSEDGRTLAPPRPGQTTTTTSGDVIETPSNGEDVRELFSLFSAEFGDGAQIPERFTCRGEGLSPPLDWVAVPPAAALALVVRDTDAGGFLHWVVTGIDPTVIGIGAGGVPEGAVEAANSAGTLGWTPPCPPDGTGVHTYAFTLHALPEPLALAPGIEAEQAAQMVEGASAASANLAGTVIG